MLFLTGRKQSQHRGNAGQKGYFVLFNVVDANLWIKGSHNHQRAAHIKSWGGAAGMKSAAVEPRGHIHGHVGGVERKMHYNVVSREHLVDIVERNSLGRSGRA